MELWKTIEDYPNYQVSNLGRVKGPRRMLQPSLNTWGYPSVSLSQENNRKTKNIHRLMGEAFLPNPNNLPYIDHINRNKQDNRLENLRWASASLNCVNKSCKDSTTQEKHICLQKSGYYRVSFWREKNHYCSMFSTLEKATAWRDKKLKSLSEEE
jgi:hypothetical protein